MDKNNQELYIYKSIVNDMEEGVLVVNMKGRIEALNPAGRRILDVGEEAIGSAFFMFMDDNRNDNFNQMVLDSIYEKSVSHNSAVDYYTKDKVKKLFVTTSYLKKDDQRIGIIAVMNDITELMELKDAVEAMNKIKKLNKQLEKKNEFIKEIFGRYLSDDIVDDILEKKNGLRIGGEKKEVTMLFSDLRGFTAISETMEPHDLIHLLNHYLECMIDVIDRWNGTILEFVGDAIFVIFGAPKPSQSAQEEAVFCAVQMQKAMEKVNAYNVEKGYPLVQMGIGIHTGDGVIGNIGSSKKMKYDIIGKHVNQASRIESCSVGGQVLISEQVYKQIKKPLLVGGEQRVWLKGLKTQTTIYDIKGIGDEKIPYEEDELETLECAVLAAVMLLEGKSVSNEKIQVQIIQCSKKRAVLRSEFPFEIFSNLEIECNGQLIYAKVMSCEQDEVTVEATYGKVSDIVKKVV